MWNNHIQLGSRPAGDGTAQSSPRRRRLWLPQPTCTAPRTRTLTFQASTLGNRRARRESKDEASWRHRSRSFHLPTSARREKLSDAREVRLPGLWRSAFPSFRARPARAGPHRQLGGALPPSHRPGDAECYGEETFGCLTPTGDAGL